MKKFSKITLLAFIAVIAFISVGCSSNQKASSNHHVTTTKQTKQTTKKLINWRKPSENKPYPSMKPNLKRWLKVSIKNQKVYVMSKQNQVLYTMYASTGIHNSTPLGTYHIQAERGKFFYNAASKEGARYWTSWKDHGIYLFHTVPTNKHGKYVVSEANQLGKTAHSHGCIRLAIPDAKWINQYVPYGTKVVIK
ncbi:cell surface protein [Philodulcilactobacillus myokoensis]|uniref:Cell surface protein n=1 Tax=Philodulcilactobacillus myokoensis TaxID=2929573 RepID=A0A9W6B0W6_9LACO|nr:L,D-transpeptidase [Philodulcilactobacillus myokoensis]GLB46109.1 cell surface protein [Philodulcilactobacillus myokoensis]